MNDGNSALVPEDEIKSLQASEFSSVQHCARALEDLAYISLRT